MDKEVEKEKISEIIKAGLYGATARGTQNPIILVISEKKTRDLIGKLNNQILGGKEGNDPFYGAPVILIVLAPTTSPNRVYDGSIVLDNMMLAAHDLGLGSCWIHRAKQEFETEEGKFILQEAGIEGGYEGIGHLALGYPSGESNKPVERKHNRVFEISSEHCGKIF